jgi:hypothetical protein
MFTRKPFVVEAIQITEENIAELAPLVGELQSKDDELFIRLDKRIVPNIHRAYVGWWITRMEDNLRCYSAKIFEDQFEAASAMAQYDAFVTKGFELILGGVTYDTPPAQLTTD